MHSSSFSVHPWYPESDYSGDCAIANWLKRRGLEWRKSDWWAQCARRRSYRARRRQAWNRHDCMTTRRHLLFSTSRHFLKMKWIVSGLNSLGWPSKLHHRTILCDNMCARFPFTHLPCWLPFPSSSISSTPPRVDDSLPETLSVLHPLPLWKVLRNFKQNSDIG